jgi:hypothetical protein
MSRRLHPRQWLHSQQGRVEPSKAAAIHERLVAFANKAGVSALEDRLKDALNSGNFSEASRSTVTVIDAFGCSWDCCI